jgi:hypothetical protein
MSPISLAPPAPGTDTTVPTLALKNTTDSPTTSKPSSGTFVPAVEIPTDPFATISMSMSMSMSLDILQFDLEDAIRPNSREFGGWKALRNTRTKDEKREIREMVRAARILKSEETTVRLRRRKVLRR